MLLKSCMKNNPVSMIMKKLLVILLLLFPVHGAWAEILNLECTVNDNKTSTHFLDTKLKIVKKLKKRNSNPVSRISNK